MIRKTGEGYKVVSHEGKSLSRPDLSREAALRRLAQIEYFKRKKI